MATIAQSLPQSSGPLPWVWKFLRQELAPYPGRTALVARMTIAATLVMIVCMTFRVPYAYQAAIYVLMISRQTSRETWKSVVTILLFTAVGAAYFLVSMRFVANLPLLHFLWVIGTFFLVFYAISTLTNNTAAVIFAIMVALGVPFWDRHVSAETNVEDTLWLCLAVLIGVVITAGVEFAFVRLRSGDEVVLPIAERLAAVENLLTCYAESRPVDPAIEREIIRLDMQGTSLLRLALRRSDYSHQYSVEIGGVVALVGRLVDLAATLTQLSFEQSANDQRRFQNLASTIATIRGEWVNRRALALVHFDEDRQVASFTPLLGEMEHTVALIPDTFADSGLVREYMPSPENLGRGTLVAPDALDNPEHLQFALKGCLAASVCYLIYNLAAWPGISTAVTTCLLTALTTIGSSHQKQILRITGAIFGGFLIGMGSQVFILPYCDSIVGFVVLFVVVTALSSWFMTSSPRLSYFGMQVAVAFYLINLDGFKMETSLAVARDRVVGILLGLFIMWLVFDQLWGAPAAAQMKKTFISNLQFIAQLAREPASKDLKTAIGQGLALRETINTNLDKVRAFADGVLLEFGSSREQDLALRNRLRQWQPNLRILFILSIVLWKYRVRLPGFELPEAIQPAQAEFDNRLAMGLDRMADRLKGDQSEQKNDLTGAYAHLEQAAWKALPKDQHQLTPKIKSFLLLSRRIATLADYLQREM
ncbi:MAG TPA: FUSC family protein [Edaphobacter sp.]|nr:FUSC family protein [Edaphobacter sp.]